MDTTQEIYLDNSATTRVSKEAAEKALYMMTECYGNPSSLHSKGFAAEKEMTAAREIIAERLSAQPGEIYFTSGGTESDNIAILGAAHAKKRAGNKIVTTAIEHPAVLNTMAQLEKEGFEVVYVQPEADGNIPKEKFDAAIDVKTILVSVMAVNNETGVLLPLKDIAGMIKRKKAPALFHTDAVQGFLKVPFSAKTLGADMITISGHKIHAPKGIGALYIRSGLKLPPYIHGGGQERGIRAGTEATPQIAAFGVAAEIGSAKMAEATKTMAELRTHAIDRLTAEVEGVTVIGGGAPHILSISLPGYRSEVLMNFLEAREIYTSKSSACKKGGRSHVLEAIGLPSNVIDGALRISFSRYTTREDIDALCDALRDAKQALFPSLH